MQQLFKTPRRLHSPAFFIVLLVVGATSGCVSTSNSSSDNHVSQETKVGGVVIPKECSATIDRPEPNQYIPVQIEPEKIYEPPIDYPKMAYTAGLEGKVLIQVLVCENGEVIDARVERSSGTIALDEAALAQAWKAKYHPAIKDGKAIKLWISYPVEFKLDR